MVSYALTAKKVTDDSDEYVKAARFDARLKRHLTTQAA